MNFDPDACIRQKKNDLLRNRSDLVPVSSPYWSHVILSSLDKKLYDDELSVKASFFTLYSVDLNTTLF